MLGLPIQRFFDHDAERVMIVHDMFESMPQIVRTLRGKKTQAVFAEELGITREVYGRLEKGKLRSVGRPVLTKILALAKAYDASTPGANQACTDASLKSGNEAAQ